MINVKSYIVNSKNRIRKFIGLGITAEAIDIEPVVGMTSTNVQAAIEELKTTGGGSGTCKGYFPCGW